MPYPDSPPLLLPERLVEMLPGLRSETLATVICGEIAARFDCPSSYLRVLHALVSHAGWHSNRVWASYPRLASLAGAVKEICLKTVQRAIRFFVRTVGLRILSDPRERRRGPGEHASVEAGNPKKGEYPVNHYDLSALRAFVPRELRERMQPRTDTAPTPGIPSPSLSSCPFSEATPHGASASCSVEGYREGVGKPEKARSEAPRPLRFEKTKKSSERIRSSADPDSPGCRALAQAGVSVGMRRTILGTQGEIWARQAALYTRLQNERGEIRTTPARYLVAVFQNWSAERAAGRCPAWPDWLMARWEREAAADARVVRDEGAGAVTQARQAVRAPGREPAPGAPDPPAGLSEPARDAARAALRRSLPGAPAALIERLIARSRPAPLPDSA